MFSTFSKHSLVVARAGVWEGMPSNLSQKLTPMLLTITNEGQVPVRVRYNEIMLVTPKQLVYKALRRAAIHQAAASAFARVPSTGIALGVYRFKSHAEAKRQTSQALARAMAANATLQVRERR